jgi:hypothetical protein
MTSGKKDEKKKGLSSNLSQFLALSCLEAELLSITNSLYFVTIFCFLFFVFK